MEGRKKCASARLGDGPVGEENGGEWRTRIRGRRELEEVDVEQEEEEVEEEVEVEEENKIRVGPQYQAVIPELKPDSPGCCNEKYKDSMLVWCPNDQLSDTMLDEYILMAKEHHGYNMEQSLGMLMWHKHDVERALADLANFTPIPDEEWTVEDKLRFKQALCLHRKNFHLIQKMLPNKSISSLVKYYYSWKKMDRQARKLINMREIDDSSDELEEAEPGSDRDSDMESKKEAVKQKPSSASNDKAVQSRSGPVKKESIGAQYRHQPLQASRRPPKQRDITSLSASHDASVSIRQLDTQLVSLKSQVKMENVPLYSPEGSSPLIIFPPRPFLLSVPVFVPSLHSAPPSAPPSLLLQPPSDTHSAFLPAHI